MISALAMFTRPPGVSQDIILLWCSGWFMRELALAQSISIFSSSFLPEFGGPTPLAWPAGPVCRTGVGLGARAALGCPSSGCPCSSCMLVSGFVSGVVQRVSVRPMDTSHSSSWLASPARYISSLSGATLVLFSLSGIVDNESFSCATSLCTGCPGRSCGSTSSSVESGSG